MWLVRDGEPPASSGGRNLGKKKGGTHEQQITGGSEVPAQRTLEGHWEHTLIWQITNGSEVPAERTSEGHWEHTLNGQISAARCQLMDSSKVPALDSSERCQFMDGQQ